MTMTHKPPKKTTTKQAPAKPYQAPPSAENWFNYY